MAERVQLVGLDFGTTTSSAVVALASLQHSATGRVELGALEETFRSEIVFTPINGEDQVDLGRVEQFLDAWLRAGEVHIDRLFGGGALLTGLTAQKSNAPGLVRLIRSRVGKALVATADDPCLESWLSFLGSCANLSHRHPDTALLNLDIGGGTTNLALGRDRQVLQTGCLFIGARHIQVSPGSYRITRISPYASRILEYLGIDKKPGATLTPMELNRYLAHCIALLEAACTGDRHLLANPCLTPLEQVPFRIPTSEPRPVITFSGGVGELIYRHVQGEPWPDTTCFGDLGIDLAQRIAAHPPWRNHLREFRPDFAGRATVYGLLQHTTEVSGNTLFVQPAGLLPLADLPILGRVQGTDSDERLQTVLQLVRVSRGGGCIQLQLGSSKATAVAEVGGRLARILDESAFPLSHPLIILVEENIGKILGQYVTRWGTVPRHLVVIDELPPRQAQYVHIGAPKHQIVPVSYFGLNPDGGDR